MTITRRSKIQVTAIATATVVFSWALIGAESAPVAPSPSRLNHATSQLLNPDEALTSLKSAHADGASTLVVQSELNNLIDPTGGGPCASAAGVNGLQALRVMAGREPLRNPHQAVLASFADQKDLLKGRVTNAQFQRLFEFYASYLGVSRLRVNVESAPNSSHIAGGRMWAAKGPDVDTAPSQLKILSYTVTELDGNVRGRHFVLLQRRRNNEITVLDPTNPLGERRYVLEFKAADNNTFERIFLLQPSGAPVRTSVYELNTIFTLDLIDLPTTERSAKSPITMESIKQTIDQTAVDLRGKDQTITPEFLSPRLWREKTASAGLPGLDLPIELGGSSWPTTKMLEIFRHVGRHNLNFRDIVGGAHVRPLLQSKHPEMQEIVREVVRGKAYIAIAMTEPDAGSDFHSIKSFAKKVDGGYLLTGEKRYVARLKQATHVVLFTRAASGKERELSAFVLSLQTPGLEHVPLEAHGLLGNSFGGLKFKEIFVKDSQLIGEDGKGTSAFTNHFRYWRLMQVATALGTAERALELMADRLRSREAYGAPIGRFTHLQQALGQGATELRMALALAREAALLVDEGKTQEADRLISGLKAEGVEIALRAVDAATRAFGGEGYSTRVDLGDRLSDLNGLRIADGTTDVMRMDVVRRTYGQDLWDMAVRKSD